MYAPLPRVIHVLALNLYLRLVIFFNVLSQCMSVSDELLLVIFPRLLYSEVLDQLHLEVNICRVSPYPTFV